MFDFFKFLYASLTCHFVGKESIKGHSSPINPQNSIVECTIRIHPNTGEVTKKMNQWFLCEHTQNNHSSMQETWRKLEALVNEDHVI